MPVFAIISTGNNHSLGQEVDRLFPDDHFKLNDWSWLIASPRTVKEVSDLLGVSDGSKGLGVVCQVDAYYGRSHTNLWPWMKTKMEAT